MPVFGIDNSFFYSFGFFIYLVPILVQISEKMLKIAEERES